MKKVLIIVLSSIIPFMVVGCSVFASPQTPEFATITDEHACLRNAPSTTAPILMYTGGGIDMSYCWAWNEDQNHTIEYRENGSIVQVIAKQNDWYKVRFYPDYGSNALVSADGVKYIEGWMKCEYLKTAEPIQLTWDNLNFVMDKHNMVDDENVRQTLFIQESLDDGLWMLYGKLEDGHINIYGSSDNLIIPISYEDDMNGAIIKRENDYNILYYGKDLSMDETCGINVQECTPQMREQIYKTISNNLYGHRYYFNIGKGNENDIRCFDIRY